MAVEVRWGGSIIHEVLAKYDLALKVRVAVIDARINHSNLLDVRVHLSPRTNRYALTGVALLPVAHGASGPGCRVDKSVGVPNLFNLL